MTPTINPTKKQYEAWQVLWDTKTKFLLFGGGAGGGKTWLYCEWLLVMAYMYPGIRMFMARNELKRLMNSTFISWGKVCSFHDVPQEDWTLDGKYNVVKFKNGSTIDLLDVAYKPTDPEYERFGSLEYTLGFGEEVSEWHFKAFDVLKSRIGRHKVYDGDKDITPYPKFGLSCNPSQGWVYRTFYKPSKENILPEQYAFIQSLYSDNPHTAGEYGEQLSEVVDKTTKARLKDGVWEYDDDAGKLMDYDNINDLFYNSIVKDNQKYIVADIARFGADSSVISVWDGLECFKIERRQKQSIEQTQELIKSMSLEFGVPRSNILIDEDGIGGGVVDNLEGVKGFVANSSPLKTRTPIAGQEDKFNDHYAIANFQNLKAQCGFKLAELVNQHKMSIKTDDENLKDMIKEDLMQVKQRDFDKDGKLKLVPKEEIKEALGRSPDVGDVLLMRAYFEVLNDSNPEQRGVPQRSLEDIVRVSQIRKKSTENIAR